MERKPLMISGVLVSVLLIAAFVMMVFGKVSSAMFWTIVILAAVYAYIILPKMKK